MMRGEGDVTDVVAGTEQHVAAPDLSAFGVRCQEGAVGRVEGFEQQVAVDGGEGRMFTGMVAVLAVGLSTSGLPGGKMSDT